MKTLRLTGEIISGKGDGAKFTRLAWARTQMNKELGFPVFPGTLNVKLTADSLKMMKRLKESKGFEISPAPGFCRAKLWKARLNDVECAVIIPEVVGYPESIVEVVASTNLRKRLGLLDGSQVEVEVTL